MIRDIGLLIMRLAFGGVMLFSHGLPKLMSFSEKKDVFPDPIGFGSTFSLSLAVFAEVVCALFLLLGLFTRFVSAPLLIAMLVAFFIIHGADPFAKKELAFMYACGYLSLICTGGGKFSLEQFKK